MAQLQLIKGTPTNRPDRFTLYSNAFLRTMEAYKIDPDDRDVLRRAVFYSVRFVNQVNEITEPSEPILSFNECILLLIGKLTPRELLTVFPVDKRYDGEKNEAKDYFTTMSALQKLGMESEIGTENVLKLMWDYQNGEVRHFMVGYLSAISELRRRMTGMGIAEEWAKRNGIRTYRSCRDEKTGKEYLWDEQTGKTTPVRHRPGYLKIVRETATHGGEDKNLMRRD